MTNDPVALFALFGVDLATEMMGDPRAGFERARQRVREEFKRRAVAEHPDHGGDAERFAELSAARDIIERIECEPAETSVTGMGIAIEVDTGWLMANEAVRMAKPAKAQRHRRSSKKH